MNMVTRIDYKDGDDMDSTYEKVTVDVISNGWLVTLESDEGEEYQYVYEFTNSKDLLDMLGRTLAR